MSPAPTCTSARRQVDCSFVSSTTGCGLRSSGRGRIYRHPVALQLDIQFVYSERFVRPTPDGLFPAGYRVPAPLRAGLRGKRVAIVNDVTNAGSAVIGTFADLEECGANVVAISSLLVLGSAAARFAASKNVPLHTIATLPNNLWSASECPLCKSGMPLQDVAAFATTLRK